MLDFLSAAEYNLALSFFFSSGGSPGGGAVQWGTLRSFGICRGGCPQQALGYGHGGDLSGGRSGAQALGRAGG